MSYNIAAHSWSKTSTAGQDQAPTASWQTINSIMQKLTKQINAIRTDTRSLAQTHEYNHTHTERETHNHTLVH